MASYGLFPEGLVIPTINQLRADYEQAMRDEYGPNFPLGDASFAGFLVGIESERLQLVWEALERVASSRSAQKSSGIFLADVSLITGTERSAAAPSTVVEALCGDDGTVVPEGSIVQTPDTLKQFLTDDDATITLLTAWLAVTFYAVDDRVTNSSRCYQCITEGVSDVSGGPITTDPDITDGTVHWVYLGEGTAAVDVDMHSAEESPIEAVSGGLTEIMTPVVGWNTATNLLDAQLGRLEQTDEQLRVTRELELQLPGTGPANAIRAELIKLSGVTNAIVFQNLTDAIADGLQPHSIECMVQGGDDQAIFDLLLNNVPAGISTQGNVTGISRDDAGIDQTFAFSRPTSVLVYDRITLTKDPDIYQGDSAVKLAISDYGQAQKIGRDAVPSAIGGAIFAADLGVEDVVETLVYSDVIGVPTVWAITTAYVATPGARSVVSNDGRKYICITGGVSAGAGGPTGVGTDITDGGAHWRFLGANLIIGNRELAVHDTSRTTILSSDGTP